MQKIISLRPNVIRDDRGAVYKIMAADLPEQALNIAEVYYSEIKYGVIKGWKKHNRMTMNLSAASGLIHMVTFDPKKNETISFDLSLNNHQVISVKPGIWVAFRGDGEKNLLLNLASIPHDPEESSSLPIDNIDYNWPSFSE